MGKNGTASTSARQHRREVDGYELWVPLEVLELAIAAAPPELLASEFVAQVVETAYDVAAGLPCPGGEAEAFMARPAAGS